MVALVQEPIVRAGEAAIGAPPALVGTVLSRVPKGNFNLVNGTISVVVTDPLFDIITIYIKTQDGEDPSPESPVFVTFRDPLTLSEETLTINAQSSAELEIADVSVVDLDPLRLWILGINDGSTFRVAYSNRQSLGHVFPLNEARPLSRSGGSNGVYCDHNFTNRPFRILGYIEWNSASIANATVPDAIALHGIGRPQPGDIIQRVYAASIQERTGATTIPLDDTAPLSSEGSSVSDYTMQFDATSKANAVLIEVDMQVSHDTSVRHFIGALFISGTCILAGAVAITTAGDLMPLRFFDHVLASEVDGASITFQAGGSAAGTWRINGPNTLGGNLHSQVSLTEIMG
jgi:hypothetical protein